MPFPNQQPRLFTRDGIEWLNAGQRGVYGILRADAWIYIGKTDCLRRRLLEHFNGDNPRITREWPTHFVTLLTYDDVRLEKLLTAEYDPTANRRIG